MRMMDRIFIIGLWAMLYLALIAEETSVEWIYFLVPVEYFTYAIIRAFIDDDSK